MLIDTRRSDPNPIFSICVPQHNRSSFFVAAIRSFSAQRFRNTEICVSDGGSTDGREDEVVAALRSSNLPFAYAKSEANLQYDPNLRTAIGLARGRYCLLMGNDDGLNGPDALAELWDEIQQNNFPGVVISDFCDDRSGQRAFRIRRSAAYPAGPETAATHFRNFSFVSGIVIDRDAAQADATSKWDGSEMYQTYLGCRMIAAGKHLLEREAVLVRKDIVIEGELVDSYARRPKVWPCPIIQRQLPLTQLGRVVADAIAPYVKRPEDRRLRERILLQLLGITYPYWLFEYRRVQSWRYSVGVALGMRPRNTADGLELGLLRRMRVLLAYFGSTLLGLTLPVSVFGALKHKLYKLAKSTT
jgi:glycosyltransferase involved in cell wall biosynthesis